MCVTLYVYLCHFFMFSSSIIVNICKKSYMTIFIHLTRKRGFPDKKFIGLLKSPNLHLNLGPWPVPVWLLQPSSHQCTLPGSCFNRKQKYSTYFRQTFLVYCIKNLFKNVLHLECLTFIANCFLGTSPVWVVSLGVPPLPLPLLPFILLGVFFIFSTLLKFTSCSHMPFWKTGNWFLCEKPLLTYNHPSRKELFFKWQCLNLKWRSHMTNNLLNKVVQEEEQAWTKLCHKLVCIIYHKNS